MVPSWPLPTGQVMEAAGAKKQPSVVGQSASAPDATNAATVAQSEESEVTVPVQVAVQGWVAEEGLAGPVLAVSVVALESNHTGRTPLGNLVVNDCSLSCTNHPK